MTFNDFIKKYNTKYLDFDGHYGCQCMDLFRSYLKEVCGLNPYTLPAVSYAKQIFSNFKSHPKFQKIVNTPTGVPQKGDIMFWNTYLGVTGIAGHVGIFVEGDVNSFISFDQNYPTGRPCGYVKHSYKGVSGWIRPVK